MFTDATTEIYEYNNSYWTIEKSRQNWPGNDGPTERVALAGALPIGCSAKEIGEVCFSALKNFNSKQPPFKPWELEELRKLFCSWVGARGWKSFYKNSRYIWIYYKASLNEITICPVDNCNESPVESAIDAAILKTKADILPANLGLLIFEAFKSATYHPERKKK